MGMRSSPYATPHKGVTGDEFFLMDHDSRFHQDSLGRGQHLSWYPSLLISTPRQLKGLKPEQIQRASSSLHKGSSVAIGFESVAR
ncbi:hypothetical protein TNCV_5075601 [Trichonephila clavipes]|uniref:Uncharacterized protein n=1 Tax=Trichonephila clavipes TaxID=2585209 RepID=A0A8X6RXP5_TRICX|nr:hypothetical protein TNCV_5075601 [Trichonephila clavipes]